MVAATGCISSGMRHCMAAYQAPCPFIDSSTPSSANTKPPARRLARCARAVTANSAAMVRGSPSLATARRSAAWRSSLRSPATACCRWSSNSLRTRRASARSKLSAAARESRNSPVTRASRPRANRPGVPRSLARNAAKLPRARSERAARAASVQVLSAEGGVEGRCRRSVGVAGEIATSGGSGVGGWRQGCHGHELSSPIDGIGHNRGWQPGAKVSMIIMRPPQQGQAFRSSCSRPSWAPSASSPD
jgi:hypothetical protein